jgi:uncharacterized protein
VLPELDTTSLMVVLLVSLLSGVVKVAVGLGAGPFLTPILALVLPPKMAVALMAPLMIITDVLALHHHWRQWDRRHVMALLPTSFLGIIAGTLFLDWASPELVRRAIGTIALMFVGLQLVRFRRRAAFNSLRFPTWGGWLIGLVGGVTSAIAHAGGVVFSIYLLSVGLAKNTFIASLVALFLVSNSVKIPLYWQIEILTFPVLMLGLAVTPIMLLGGRIGIALNRRLSLGQFDWIIVTIVGLSGLLLLVRS